MICSEMAIPEKKGVVVELSRFEMLPRTIKAVLNDLFEETWKQRELPPEQHLRPFMAAWNLLAYTAEITTGSRNDEEWHPAIRADSAWEQKFNHVMENPKSLMRMYTRRFAESWPIYDTGPLV